MKEILIKLLFKPNSLLIPEHWDFEWGSSVDLHKALNFTQETIQQRFLIILECWTVISIYKIEYTTNGLDYLIDDRGIKIIKTKK